MDTMETDGSTTQFVGSKRSQFERFLEQSGDRSNIGSRSSRSLPRQTTFDNYKSNVRPPIPPRPYVRSQSLHDTSISSTKTSHFTNASNAAPKPVGRRSKFGSVSEEPEDMSGSATSSLENSPVADKKKSLPTVSPLPPLPRSPPPISPPPTISPPPAPPTVSPRSPPPTSPPPAPTMSPPPAPPTISPCSPPPTLSLPPLIVSSPTPPTVSPPLTMSPPPAPPTVSPPSPTTGEDTVSKPRSNTDSVIVTGSVQPVPQRPVSAGQGGNKVRPPPPIRPPPCPPRPFPPPISEDKLAKKRAPPKPPTIIDSRSDSPKRRDVIPELPDEPQDHLDQYPDQSPTLQHHSNSPPHSAIPTSPPARPVPKRPPPPTLSAPLLHITTSDDSSTDKKKVSDSPTKTVTPAEATSLDIEPPENNTIIDSESPNTGKKLVNRMKASFRSLTTRRRSREREHESDERRVRVNTSPSLARKNISADRYPESLPRGVLEPLVIRCVAYLNRESVLNEIGLFRIPGDLTVIRSLREQFTAGKDVDLNEILDPHTVAGLLKLHFRDQLCQPLLPKGKLQQEAAILVRQKDVEGFKELLTSFDSISSATLRMIAELLCKISQYSDINHMTSGTLATSCGPSFFPNLPASSANSIIKFLIDNCNQIFED